ncbi:MAG TPA: helix-turn-helix domain-containing protein [Aequorivita sp.]|nr:helix-turn-helix domain-containing protein [Aequorivita sp.]
MNNPFEVIDARLSRIENLLKHLPKNVESSNSERKFDVRGAAKFLGITPPTIYTKVSKGELPFCKAPGSKRLFFYENDLNNYLKSGRKKSNAEIIAEANTYLSNRKGKSRE